VGVSFYGQRLPFESQLHLLMVKFDVGNGISVYGYSGPQFGPYSVSLDGGPSMQFTSFAENGTADPLLVRAVFCSCIIDRTENCISSSHIIYPMVLMTSYYSITIRKVLLVSASHEL
jgi:hypothetical protein